MARIYQPTEYGSSFQGSAREEQFSPVQPFDQSEAIKKRAQDKIDNIKNLARASEIQANLDRATLAGNQQIAKAQFEGKWKVVQGILSLTKTGIDAYSTIKADQEKRNEEAQILDSLGWGVETPETKTDDNDDDVYVTSESKSINETTKELIDEGTVESVGLANQLQESSTYNLTKTIKSNVYEAKAIHELFLIERLKNIPDNEKPRTDAEAITLLRSLNREFFRETGLLDSRLKNLILKELSPTMVENSKQYIRKLVTSGIKADQEANLEEAKSFVSIQLDSNKSAEEIWGLVSERFANGNVGFVGYSDASNKAALIQILEEASLMGHDGSKLITALRRVAKRPGVKGTELEKTYDHIFDQYEDKLTTNAIKDFNESQSLAKIKNKKIVDNYYDDPTFDNKQKAIKALKETQTPESLALANKLLQTGFGYDPNKETELLEQLAAGKEIDPILLTQLLDEQTISQEVYNQAKEGGPYRASKKIIDTELNKLNDVFVAALLKGVPKQDQTSELQTQAGIRMISLKQDIKDAVMAEVRVTPGLVNDKFELAKIIDKQQEYFLNQPQYKADVDPDKGLIFPSDFQTAAPYNVVGKKGVQDFSQLTYNELFVDRTDLRAEINATKDYLLTKNELQAASERYLLDGSFSENLTKFANELGLSEKAFLNSQLKVRLGKDLKALQKINNSEPFEYTFNTVENTQKYFVTETGLPFNTAGFLAANLEANNKNNERGESGLISYTAWHDSPSRLVAIENHFGKKAKQLTEAEQLSYMIKEMKEQFPDVYRVFINPNATNSALIAASAQYFGTMRGTTLDKANALIGNPQ